MHMDGVAGSESLRLVRVGDCLALVQLQLVTREDDPPGEVQQGPAMPPSLIMLGLEPPRWATPEESAWVVGELALLHGRLKELARAAACVLHDLDPLIDTLTIPLPTVNGWLLEYPVVYTFSKQQGLQASRSLSSLHLHLYSVHAASKVLEQPQQSQQGQPRSAADSMLLLGWSVPCNLSVRGPKEEWARSLVERMLARRGPVEAIWKVPRLQVVLQPLQAVAL
eukprot:jgi/Mesen1/2699/ME000167S01854